MAGCWDLEKEGWLKIFSTVDSNPLQPTTDGANIGFWTIPRRSQLECQAWSAYGTVTYDWQKRL